MAEEIVLVPENPVAVLTDPKKYSEFYKRIKDEVAGHTPDLTTAMGRGKIAALAYKVTRTKTAIDAAGKRLNEDARKTIDAVDAQRRKIRNELDALAEEVRKPLTDWEKAEAERTAEVERILRNIGDLTIAPANSSETIRQYIETLRAIELDIEVFRDDLHNAALLKDTSLQLLADRLTNMEKSEADAAELAKLRCEQEEREQAERQKLAKEAAKKAEQERREREAAEINAREERAAEVARQEERRKASEAVAKAENEAKQLRDMEARRLIAEEEERKAQAKRDADRKHRGEVMKAAKEAIIALGADEDTAKKVVLAIVAGEIPNVSLRF